MITGVQWNLMRKRVTAVLRKMKKCLKYLALDTKKKETHELHKYFRGVTFSRHVSKLSSAPIMENV